MFQTLCFDNSLCLYLSFSVYFDGSLIFIILMMIIIKWISLTVIIIIMLKPWEQTVFAKHLRFDWPTKDLSFWPIGKTVLENFLAWKKQKSSHRSC